MKGLSVSKTREGFPDAVHRAAYEKERTIVSHRGKKMAAIVPIEDLKLIDGLTRKKMNHVDLKDARAALKEAREKGTISLRDLVKKLGD